MKKYNQISTYAFVLKYGMPSEYIIMLINTLFVLLFKNSRMFSSDISFL